MRKIPKLLLHSKGFYFVRVTIDGKRRDYNFGKDRKDAEFRYNQFVSELCQVRNAPTRRRSSIVSVSINELVVRYLEGVRELHKKSSDFSPFRSVCKLLCRLFGESPVSSFTVSDFYALISEMTKSCLSLKTVNLRICITKQFFKYALDCEVITAEKYFQVKSVSLLRSSDGRVKPPRIVPPVDVDVVERTLPYLSPLIKDMVTVQLHSGMRASELCRLNWKEIDMTGRIWIYRPLKHKTASRGKTRSIPLGPVCQTVLFRYIKLGGVYVFNPNNNSSRRSSILIPTGTRLDHYNTTMYLKELKIGVDAAIADGAITSDERWTSHQLRHRAGTDARALFGIDAVQLLLGHSDVKTSERYALPDESKLFDFVLKTG